MAARFQNHHPSSRFEPPYVRPVGPPNLSPQDTSSFVRPLSDIREITEPSIADIVASRPAPDRNPHSNQQPPKPQRQPSAAGRATSVRIVDPQQTISKGKQRLETHFSSDTGSEQGADVSSAFGIPSASVPQRTASRKSAGADTPALYGHAHSAAPTRINEPPRQSSPSRRRPAQLNSEASQRIPSQTVIRDPCPFDVVDQPTLKHHRLHAYLQVIAPLFVGGGSIEGFVQIAVETPERQRGRHNIFLSRVAIDLLGVEELVGQHRRSVFLSLGTELISAEQPPPAHMTRSPIPLSYRDPHWILQPSNSTLPFRLSLPLDVGSAPFTSKSARVRFQLSVSVHFAEGDHRFIVRNSQAVTVLSTYDPERALRSLPSPLTAFDEIHMAKSDHIDVIGLTARLHRQVWVSGTSIFVDVHIANNSRKVVRRMDLSIERATLFYKHSAAATLEKSASQARIFEDKEQTILSKTTVKLSTAGRNGVAPYSDTTRTCNIDIPRDHATVRCGKFFEVRYFLNISAGTSHALLSVQLPIILIHMNSLDVVPNAVGQVTVAIEEKRAQHHEAQARKLSGQSDHAGGSSKQQSRHAAAVQSHKSRKVQSIQGRAFAAPRSQSLDRMKAQAADLEQLGHELERSPRRMHNSGRRARYSPERPASRAPQPPPKDPRLRSPSYRHTDQHRFGLSGNNSQNSFAGPGIGSYTMLNGGSTAAMADAVIGNAPYTQQYTGLTDTVRRKIRSLKSLESFHRRPSRSEMRTTRSPSPYHAHANAGHDGTADIPLPPTFTRKHIQLPRSILRVGSSPARGRQRRTADEIYSAERAHHDYGTVDTRSRSAARQPGHIPAKSGLASRASSRLRDSFDRGRFEFPAVGWNQRSTEENNGAGLTAGITEGVKGLLRKGKEVVEGVMSPAKGNVEVAVPTISRPEWIEGARVGWL